MGAYTAIEQVYPKVRPLAQSLIAAAAEQGASVEEFEMACALVKEKARKKALAILVSELKRET